MRTIGKTIVRKGKGGFIGLKALLRQTEKVRCPHPIPFIRLQVYLPSLSQCSNRQNYFHQQYAISGPRNHRGRSPLNDYCHSRDFSDASS